MKNNQIITFRQGLFLLVLIPSIWLTSSCRQTKSVSFNITQPAEITLPSDVNTILLVDRTKFKNGMLNTLEGILTGELPADDKAAAQEALNSLKMKLDFSPRYSVRILPDRLIGNSMTAAFPQALPWKTIDSLCVTNKSDIVVCLEVFDSNFIITNGTRIKKKKEGTGKDAKEVSYTEYFAQGVGSIKMGIRCYYSKEKTIIDQQMISRNNTWTATGTNALDAAAALISKSNANKQLAIGVGDEYAYKISPMPIRISRPFFGKSKRVREIEIGARYADVNKWEEAINEWKTGLPKAGSKEAGQMAYNIAVAYEVLGEYGTALTWAQDAYTKYGNNEARQYVYTIQNRIDEERLLKEQMNH